MAMFERQEDELATSVKEYRDRIDFSVLSPLLTEIDIQRAINVAIKNHYRSVCVLPYATNWAAQIVRTRQIENLKIGTVVGFPLGANLLSIKLDEARCAFSDGADYVDVVLNLSNIKAGDFYSAKKEISRLVRLARKKEINVIIETSALSREEIAKICKICVKCKVDNVMTNTGFGSCGASPEIVEVLSQNLAGKVGIKASGGISSRADVWNVMRAGATLVATSREV